MISNPSVSAIGAVNENILSVRPIICPEHVLKQVKASPATRIAIVNAGASLPMEAAHMAVEAGIMQPILIGREDDIATHAKNIGWDISNIPLIEATDAGEAAARAFSLARSGECDAVMKGDISTDIFMKAAVNREKGIRTQSRLVHVFYMSAPDEKHRLLISDAAVNINPDIETRKDAICALVIVAKALGCKNPKIALLSASEKILPTLPSSVDAETITEWAQATDLGATIYGPLALDLALSPEAAKIKGMSNYPIAGNADAVLVPDIVSGNILFKSMVYMGGYCAAGVVLGGMVPILLTSRADPPAARLASIALAAILRHMP